MSPSAPTTSAERVLHCSPARTVLARTEAATGETVVAKIYVSGAMADAEREFAWGHLARGAGTVTYLAVHLDAASNRPCVTTRHEEGTDLDRLVAEQGALPAASACALLAPVAATLARLHTLRSPEAPAGLCHGDVKPKNLLRTAHTTLLLDFEHALPIAGPGSTTAMTFGTSAFAAPEAARGAAPSAALDVHALGATLAWLLAGGGSAVPQDPRVEALVAACTHADPARRPRAAEVAEQLAHLAAALPVAAGEAVLADWTTGTLRAEPPGADDRDPRVRPWRRRRRLLARRPTLLTPPQSVPVEPGPLLTALTATGAVLDRFPRCASVLRWRRELQKAAGQLLGHAAPHTAAQTRLEAFAAAAAWLDQLERLARTALPLPGGVTIPCDEGTGPGLLQRDPLAMLQRLRAQVEAAHAGLRDEVERVAIAERQLDLRGAEAAVDEMAARHGGTSPTASRQRDRLHRLAFYLGRAARAESNVERVASLWDATALQPLTSFVAAAVAAAVRTTRGDGPASTVGLRSLQLTLANLAEEFPHLPQVGPAFDALTQALAHLTDQAWQLLAAARQDLQSIPVPVRPLQLTLGRLDTFRVLEAFLDRPDRPRSQLLDQIESLRLALEQARATRDRLAESAESAMARGHWTTGLFDMERAVAGLEPVDDREVAEATRLQERLQEARRRKQEVESTVRRNVDLTTLYGTLQDDPTSSFASRLHVLEERRDCLLFLTMHVPAERGMLYHRDLRDVDTQIAVERAALAEHQLDGTVDAAERLRIARTASEQLSESLARGDQDRDPPGRVVRLLEHWRTVTAHCQRAVDQLQAERAMRLRQRRHVWLVAVAAIVATTAAVAFAVRPWLRGEPTLAAGKDGTTNPGK